MRISSNFKRMSGHLCHPADPGGLRGSLMTAGTPGGTVNSTRSWLSTGWLTGTPGRSASLGLGPIWQSENEALKGGRRNSCKKGRFLPSVSPSGSTAPISTPPRCAWRRSQTAATAPTEKNITSGTATLLPWFRLLARSTGSGDYVFFVADYRNPSYELIRNVTPSQSYVAQFTLHDYPYSGRISSPQVRLPGMQPSTRSTSVNTTWAGHRSASARTPFMKPSTTRLTGACTAWL